MKSVKTIGMVCLFALSAMATDLVSSLKEAVAIADEQEKALATHDYFAHSLLPDYEQRYGPVFQTCFTSTRHAESAPFEFAAAIGSDGGVMRVYTNQDTIILKCVRLTLEKDVFPKSPVAPYYLHIDMRFVTSPMFPPRRTLCPH